MGDGTAVYIEDHTGIKWYFSPGCSVTETMTLGVNTAGREEFQENSLYIIPTDFSHIIRIDATILTYSDENSNGTTNYPSFDPYMFNAFMKNTSSAGQDHTLYWRGYTFNGLVKSVTVTQRPGEGNMCDVAVTFEVGEVAGAE
jgi:hypothetical protein